jgi:2-polyprenyl-3-methyl-5-hydroxy-6-metoxy-1,4-benzoquinol methylase
MTEGLLPATRSFQIVPSPQSNDDHVVESWHLNALPWTAAVRGNQIESRSLVTNQAIVDAVLGRSPSSVLDIGCGEGWLARALSSHGIDVIGIDVVPALIEQAKQAGGGTFRVSSYEELVAAEPEKRVDVAIANFSLIGREPVQRLILGVPALLAPGGSFIVQTLHPVASCGELPYEDGWRPGSWEGFGKEFSHPAPWYFRTMESWTRLMNEGGLRLIETREPLNHKTGKPASVIFVAAAR